MFVLAFLCVIQIIMGILKIVFFSNIGTSDTIKILIQTLVAEGGITMDLDDLKAYLTTAGGLFGGLTMVGCFCGCCALFCAKKMNRPCKGWFTKMQVFLTFAIFLVMAIIWLIVGAAISVPYNLGGEFIDNQCKYAVEKDTANQKVSFGMGVEVPTTGSFDVFVDFDSVYKQTVVAQMCTDFCMCPGKPGDAWYDEYKENAAELAKFGRKWDDSITGKINV